MTARVPSERSVRSVSGRYQRPGVVAALVLFLALLGGACQSSSDRSDDEGRPASSAIRWREVPRTRLPGAFHDLAPLRVSATAKEFLVLGRSGAGKSQPVRIKRRPVLVSEPAKRRPDHRYRCRRWWGDGSRLGDERWNGRSCGLDVQRAETLGETAVLGGWTAIGHSAGRRAERPRDGGGDAQWGTVRRGCHE